jgi:lipoyl(octanoyl) transferase
VQPLRVVRLGTVGYDEALALQHELVERRGRDEIPDHLLLLQHPHVITLGVRTLDARSHIVAGEQELEALGVTVHETGRGGDVTYHGPGQLVGYPILALEPERHDLHRYVRDLEETLIRALARFEIAAGRVTGLTGVWVGSEKVAAIGVRVGRWVTSHGFALNVTTDLDYFGLIVPCGIPDRGVTSMARLLGAAPPIDAVEQAVVSEFCTVFGRMPELA